MEKKQDTDYNTNREYQISDSINKSGSLTKTDIAHTLLVIVFGSLFGWITFYSFGLISVEMFPSLRYDKTYVLLGMMYSVVPLVAGLITHAISRSNIPQIVSNGSLAGWMSFAPLTIAAVDFMSENQYELVQEPMEHFPHLLAIVFSGILFGYLGGRIGNYLSKKSRN